MFTTLRLSLEELKKDGLQEETHIQKKVNKTPDSQGVTASRETGERADKSIWKLTINITVLMLAD